MGASSAPPAFSCSVRSMIVSTSCWKVTGLAPARHVSSPAFSPPAHRFACYHHGSPAGPRTCEIGTDSNSMHMRNRLLTLTALGLVPAFVGAQAPRLRVPATVDTLPNGLTLIVHEDHSVPRVATNIWYRVGSGDERLGRTGFAHLFEHLMFMGSEHAPYPQFDKLLEPAGMSANGSTTEDRTNYLQDGASAALPVVLWLEADRMGWMLPTMDSAKVDAQRDIVKNERRQSYENQPYGKAADILPPALYPKDHPYSWPVIGSMADLSAASLEDVKDFFRRYYAPNNAAIVIAGAVNTDSVRRLVTKYFGDIPRGP